MLTREVLVGKLAASATSSTRQSIGLLSRRLQVRFLCGAPQVEIWLQAMQDDALESAIPQIGPSYDLLPPARFSDYNKARYL